MDKTLEIIRGRARSETISAKHWAECATKDYGRRFQETNPDGLWTKLWRAAYTRRDLLFEILAEVENVDLSEIIERYSTPCEK